MYIFKIIYELFTEKRRGLRAPNKVALVLMIVWLMDEKKTWYSKDLKTEDGRGQGLPTMLEWLQLMCLQPPNLAGG